MGQVIVRHRVCKPGIDGSGANTIQHAHIGPASEFEVSVRMASLISVNARATPIRGRVRYWSRVAELRLLLSFLDERRFAPLLLRATPFHASAGHIRRFVSEGAGLGLLTGVTEAIYGWRAGRTTLANFDALPTSLVHKYKASGVRPDLLFQLREGDLAGEARGRSSPPPKSVRADQLQKLQKLLVWSDAHDEHPFVMSWASVTETGTTIDFFECRMDGGFRRNPRRPARERGRPIRVMEDALPQRLISDGVPEATVPSRPTRPQADQTRPGDLAAEADECVRQVDEELYESAPELSDGIMFDRSVRGAWAPLDLLGEPGDYLFLGIMSHALSEDEAEGVAARRSRRGLADGGDEDAPVQGEITGRLIAAVTRDRRPEPPSIRELRDALE
ncbi:hypothetical protein [Actinomadura sp. RB99]|uniref:hypothetical protein n=1 Tax=Actinomadura sp. RB99 TaxID=2691577 RepID=UPI001682335C|nr:hypothetical protein [Actinomadura sp. RB99]